MRQVTMAALIGVAIALLSLAIAAPWPVTLLCAIAWGAGPFLPGRTAYIPLLAAPPILTLGTHLATMLSWQAAIAIPLAIAAWVPFWLVQGAIPWRRGLPLLAAILVVPFLAFTWFAPTLFLSDVATRSQAILLVLVVATALMASRTVDAWRSHLPR